MRNYDFSPLWRSTVGFDRLFDLINSEVPHIQDTYPPYDIVRTGPESYRISIALAGFAPEQITITAQQNRLTVAGRRRDDDAKKDFIYQSVATRPFERHFSLADYVEVERATFENGLLQIDFVRRVPDAMKPRRIQITGPSVRVDDATAIAGSAHAEAGTAVPIKAA
jgi:molecular chaperone IbpA